MAKKDFEIFRGPDNLPIRLNKIWNLLSMIEMVWRLEKSLKYCQRVYVRREQGVTILEVYLQFIQCECEDDDETTVATHISTRSNGYPSNNGAPTSTKRPSNNGSSNNGGSSSVTGSVILRDKWVNGANCILAFKNNGNARACGVKFELTLGDNVCF